jgi:hypothetical protein
MIKLVGPRDTKHTDAVNVTSSGDSWAKNLSPMLLGPIEVPNRGHATCVENAWQYSKVYDIHDKRGQPSTAWFFWSKKGYTNPRGVRYPMGKGTIPLYSYWNSTKMDYITARKEIYMPIYKNAAIKSGWYSKLEEYYYLNDENIVLWDYDAYDYIGMGLTADQIINDPKRILGHGHILAMMLRGEY